MASAAVAAGAADMDPAGKLPEEAAADNPVARVGEWQPCVVEQDIAKVEGDSILDRALEERDRTAEEDTSKREGMMSSMRSTSFGRNNKRTTSPVPPF